MAGASIMRFAKKKVSCLGCRQPLDDPEGILCDHCSDKARPAPCARPPAQLAYPQLCRRACACLFELFLKRVPRQQTP